MKSLVFFGFYNLALILAWPWVWLTGLFNAKLRGNLAGQKEWQRAVQNFQRLTQDDPRPVIWLHAASAGEFEQMQPVLDRFREEKVWIFQTFTSSTIYYKTFKDKRFHGVSYLPWDLPWRVRRFIRSLQPDLFLNTRHDLWPNLLRTLRRLGVRSVLINANLYVDSRRLWPVLKSLNRLIFTELSAVYTISPEVAELLERLGRKSEVAGDTRFDRVLQRAARNPGNRIPEQVIRTRPVVVCGSVLESDREILVAAIHEVLAWEKVLFVLVPHEIRERDLVPWEVALYRKDVSCARRSEMNNYQGEDVLIWNSVGELADLYAQADLAYVGAGFGAGVHSVTEAAVYGVPAAHGPYYQILAEASELVELGISRVIHDSGELVEWLGLLQKEEERTILRNRLVAYMDQRGGATEHILGRELPLLLHPPGD